MAIAVLIVLSTQAVADELTKMIEQDLARLGYDTGPVDGEETLETTIAISKFQAEHQLDVTGEVSSELARTLMAAEPGGGAVAATGTAAATAAEAAPAPAVTETSDEALQAAQQACLQEKMMAAQEAARPPTPACRNTCVGGAGIRVATSAAMIRDPSMTRSAGSV